LRGEASNWSFARRFLQELTMSEPSRPRYAATADWEAAYREGTPPWDVGRPHAELARVLDEYRLRPRTVLEIGCGTGADAILLARRRFEVTAVDCSPIAIERARSRAEQHDAVLRFVQDDIFEFAQSSGPFDFVYDSGLYHAIRRVRLSEYLDVLWRVTQPGSYFLCFAAAPSGTTASSEDGPPEVAEDEIHNELGRLFEFLHLRPTRLEGTNPGHTHTAWSCLMRRPVVNSG
jgi:methyl halide transferase